MDRVMPYRNRDAREMQLSHEADQMSAALGKVKFR